MQLFSAESNPYQPCVRPPALTVTPQYSRPLSSVDEENVWNAVSSEDVYVYSCLDESSCVKHQVTVTALSLWLPVPLAQDLFTTLQLGSNGTLRKSVGQKLHHLCAIFLSAKSCLDFIFTTQKRKKKFALQQKLYGIYTSEIWSVMFLKLCDQNQFACSLTLVSLLFNIPMSRCGTLFCTHHPPAPPKRCMPRTALVDWALKNNYLSV